MADVASPSEAPSPPDLEAGSAPSATVYVSDPSAEAERVAQQLRVAGYAVVDVPLSMLVARVAVQPPQLVVLDADAEGAGDAIERVRKLGTSSTVHVLLLGGGGGSDDLAGLERIARPVDPQAVVRRIEALTGGPVLAAGPPRSTAASPALPPRPSVPPPSVSPWAPFVPERRSPPPVGLSPSVAPLSGRPSPSSTPQRDSPLSARSVRPSISIQTALSAELEALLADAEQRVGAHVGYEALPPSPEDEIEAVLPAALLAALDEPLDDGEDDDALEASMSRAALSEDVGEQGGAPQETNAGRALTQAQGPSARSRGLAPTLAAPAMTGSALPPAPAPIPPLDAPAALPMEAEDRSAAAKTGRTTTLGRDDVPKLIAEAIASRSSGCLTFESPDGVRRVVVREGDVVTAASSADDESLLVFLTTRGDVRHDEVRSLVGKVPPFGRHAGAALVGHGILRQDQLWPTLRSHAEWLLGRTLKIDRGISRFDVDAPGRLRQEPSVFGGSSGGEVIVEVLRRVLPADEAVRRLGGPEATVLEGPTALLGECALGVDERAAVEGARGLSLGLLAGRGARGDLGTVLYALALLGVITVAAPVVVPIGQGPGAARETSDDPSEADLAALDLAAVRERVTARLQLVAESDYFTLLGVPRDATGYDIRRAFLELRRGFEPSLLLTPELADLAGDVRTIVSVLEEAYEILRDGARRERYRRALGDAP